MSIINLTFSEVDIDHSLDLGYDLSTKDLSLRHYNTPVIWWKLEPILRLIKRPNLDLRLNL